MGIKAVIPYEVGMSFANYSAPLLSIKYTYKNGFYLQGVLQRSIDADSGVDENNARNRIGLRFLMKGDKALYIPEIGFKRKATSAQKAMWFRVTGWYNTTAYQDYNSLYSVINGTKGHNGAVSIMQEQQIWQPDKSLPFRGIYWAAMGQWAPSNYDLYHQYYQLAVYELGLWRKRPFDMATINLNRTQFSRTVLNTLQQLPNSAQNPQTGLPTFDDSTNVNLTYGFHIRPGLILSTNFGYTKHPTYAPRLDNPVTGLVSLVTFW
jgi:porin